MKLVLFIIFIFQVSCVSQFANFVVGASGNIFSDSIGREIEKKILEHLWVLFIGIGSWVSTRLIGKIDELDKTKASSDDISSVRSGLSDLDKRVDDIDHATQLRLVPRSEYKSDIRLLFAKISEVAEKLCEIDAKKEDRIKTIRLKENNVNKKGK